MHIVLTLISVPLLLAIVALIKERRLRMALQQILKRLIERWRSNANPQNPNPSDHDHASHDHSRM